MSPDRPKVPRGPSKPLIFEDGDFATIDQLLFRIHNTGGRYPIAWNEFRTFGPLDTARWDPHPLPPDAHPGFGVLYAATDYVTPFAEVFQHRRRINLTAGPRILSGWDPTRPLRLLDLTGNWPIRNEAAGALQYAPRSTCRAWARAIRAQAPSDIDGLLAESTMTGNATRVVVLWEGATNHLPKAPSMSRALSDPAISAIVFEAVETTGYAVAARS